MDYIIRQMKPDDWGEIVEIYSQGVQSNVATFNIYCPSYEEWDGAHTKDCRLVAEYDSEIVGWAALSPTSKRECYKGVAEDSIYIDVNHCGKGLGTKLLSALIEESEKCGYWTVQAHIIQNNPASIRLHEKCGFRMVGFRERIAKDRFGMWRNTVIMEHRITKDIAGGCDCEMIKAMQKEKQ